MVSKTADFWITKGKGIMCTLCPHKCFLLNGEIGRCRVRKNFNGKLISMVYGYPCAVQIDPIEKKPLYHFLPGTLTLSTSTIGCNLRCLNCQNYQISQSSLIDKVRFVSPDDLVNAAINNQCKSISYTYTDPVVYYEYASDIAVAAKEKGLKNIIVSAGYINKKPLRQWCKYIDAANIDLKCFNDGMYQKLSQVRLKPVLNTLEILKEENVWLEITNLIIPEYTDDLKMIDEMCKWLVASGFSEVPLHFSRFHPSHKLSHLPPTSITILNNAYEVALNSGLKYVYLGNIPNSLRDNTYCTNCSALLIERSGFCSAIKELQNNRCANCGTLLNGFFI